MQTRTTAAQAKTSVPIEKTDKPGKAWLIHHPYALVCLAMAAIVLYNLPEMPFPAVVVCAAVLYAVPSLIVSEIKSKAEGFEPAHGPAE